MAHNNYYLDLCVDTFVVYDDKVLLRFHDKYEKWMAPGGHIDPGEDANEAAIREVWEEAGLEISLVGPHGWSKQDTDINRDLVPPLFVNRHAITETHDHSSFVFVAITDSDEVDPKSEEDKKSGARFAWVTDKELDAMHENDADLRADVYRYAKSALALVASSK